MCILLVYSCLHYWKCTVQKTKFSEMLCKTLKCAITVIWSMLNKNFRFTSVEKPTVFSPMPFIVKLFFSSACLCPLNHAHYTSLIKFSFIRSNKKILGNDFFPPLMRTADFIVKSSLFFFRRVRNISIRDYQLCHFCQSATARLPLDEISWNFIFEYFLKMCLENSGLINIWQ